MKTYLPYFILPVSIVCLLSTSSCKRDYYTAPDYLTQQTANHKLIAIVPAEMVFTGKQPQNLLPEDIAALEEKESMAFQESLLNGILRYANTRNYYMAVSVQDINTTRQLLKKNNISVRASWTWDERELASLLGVDAIVRMRIQKKRYMSDAASYSIGVGKQILGAIGNASRVSIPYIPTKTNDIYAACNLVTENRTIWNDSYKASADWNNPPDMVIDNITARFGRNFPYKKRR